MIPQFPPTAESAAAKAAWGERAARGFVASHTVQAIAGYMINTFTEGPAHKPYNCLHVRRGANGDSDPVTASHHATIVNRLQVRR